MLQEKQRHSVAPGVRLRIDRAHERKAEPRCNDLATSFVYFSVQVTTYVCRPPQAKGPMLATGEDRSSGILCEKLTLAAIRFILDTISPFR
jgi:hypothetical protein